MECREARVEGRTDNVVTFTIDGKNTTTNNDIYYEIMLTYGDEIDGKTIEVKDTLICEYEGFAADAAKGFYRTWKSSLKSGKTRITLFQNQELEIFFTPNINHWEAGAFYKRDVPFLSTSICKGRGPLGDVHFLVAFC